MQKRIAGLPFFRAGVCFVLVVLCDAASALAGGTALSYQIEAEAQYVAASGRMSHSVAEARKIHAEAAALEIQNSIDYVKAYFERRRLNQEEWAKAHPNEMQCEKHRQGVQKQTVEDQYQRVMRGDVTNTLNWLLKELSRPVVSYQYLLGAKSVAQPELDAKLTARDLQMIRLTDGGRAGNRLDFPADKGEVLVPDWPLGLRSDKCKIAREKFEQTRKDIITEMQKNRTLSPKTQDQLMVDVNALFVALDNAYPIEHRDDSAATIADYGASHRFLLALLASAHRVATLNDPSVFDRRLRFQGDSLLALVQHMYQNGLEFAPPKPGAEGVYKTLFQNLRALYISMGEERSHAANGQEGAAGRAEKPVDQPLKTEDDPKRDRAT